MKTTSSETIIASLFFMAFWILTVLVILILGLRWAKLQGFRQKMIAQWKPSLMIALSFAISMALGGRGFLNPYSLAIFCQSLIGLALAKSIPNFEPLTVARSIQQREHAWRKVIIMLMISLLVVFPALLIGSVGLSIGQQVFHEQNKNNEAMGTFPSNPVSTLFLLFSGAGIGEETPYRLVCLCFFWWLTRRRYLSIFLSALIFGLYHLTPLTSMYQIFWQYPISQFTASVLIGLVWGTLFVKRGYETVVLGHTFSDWIPYLLFAK